MWIVRMDSVGVNTAGRRISVWAMFVEEIWFHVADRCDVILPRVPDGVIVHRPRCRDTAAAGIFLARGGREEAAAERRSLLWLLGII